MILKRDPRPADDPDDPSSVPRSEDLLNDAPTNGFGLPLATRRAAEPAADPAPAAPAAVPVVTPIVARS